MTRPPPTSTLFPYTTLFRSLGLHREHQAGAHRGIVDDHRAGAADALLAAERSEEHTSQLQSRFDLVCCLLLEINIRFDNSSVSDAHALRFGRSVKHYFGPFL